MMLSIPMNPCSVYLIYPSCLDSHYNIKLEG